MSKHYCGTYKGHSVYQEGQMIGSNWYGHFYVTRKVNGRNIKIKESVCRSVKEIKEFINKQLKDE